MSKNLRSGIGKFDLVLQKIYLNIELSNYQLPVPRWHIILSPRTSHSRWGCHDCQIVVAGFRTKFNTDLWLRYVTIKDMREKIQGNEDLANINFDKRLPDIWIFFSPKRTIAWVKVGEVFSKNVKKKIFLRPPGWDFFSSTRFPETRLFFFLA